MGGGFGGGCGSRAGVPQWHYYPVAGMLWSGREVTSSRILKRSTTFLYFFKKKWVDGYDFANLSTISTIVELGSP